VTNAPLVMSKLRDCLHAPRAVMR